jgi:hypothetical protein
VSEIDLAAYARETYAASRIAQGLSPTLTDPVALDRLAALIDTDPPPIRKAAS